jgi:hypothetical protein
MTATRRQLCSVICFLLLAGFLQGCAGRAPTPRPALPGRPAQAGQFLADLDAAAAAAGVTDASSFKVPGFPYLRTNRFLAAMTPRIAGGPKRGLWVEEMVRLGRTARCKEIQNLPRGVVDTLLAEDGRHSGREALQARAAAAAAELFDHDRRQPSFSEALKDAVVVPQEYATYRRVFGLYPLAAIPVNIATRRAYRKFENWHRSPASELEVEGVLTEFVPAGVGNRAADMPAEIFAAARLNAFGLPELSQADTLALVRFYAPVITQDVVADYDHIGEVVWAEGAVTIDQNRPAVYHYITHSFIGRIPVLQINYAFWYSERSGRKAPPFEKGPLDGLTLRISLDRQGQPLMADIMNTCGCYHFYAPQRRSVAEVTPSKNGLYPFVPVWLPPGYPQRPLTLQVNSGWHQVERLFAAEASAGAAAYRLIPYERLEVLPHGDGSHESVFTAEGIMKNSHRIEPYIFFSLGIPDIGYMRQRSRHAVKMVGRAHFTDADIYDRNFVFHPDAPPRRPGVQ